MKSGAVREPRLGGACHHGICTLFEKSEGGHLIERREIMVHSVKRTRPKTLCHLSMRDVEGAKRIELHTPRAGEGITGL